MPISNLEQLEANSLERGSQVIFKIDDLKLRYFVGEIGVHVNEHPNEIIFDLLGLYGSTRAEMVKEAYGYKAEYVHKSWPCFKDGDYEALKRLFIEIYKRIEGSEQEEGEEVATNRFELMDMEDV